MYARNQTQYGGGKIYPIPDVPRFMRGIQECFVLTQAQFKD
ncbi:MAG TPA: hypothetical protein PK657_08200 [Legionella sp.]|nr:hypothetical protein [Legionella sp.]